MTYIDAQIFREVKRVFPEYIFEITDAGYVAYPVACDIEKLVYTPLLEGIGESFPRVGSHEKLFRQPLPDVWSATHWRVTRIHHACEPVYSND